MDSVRFVSYFPSLKSDFLNYLCTTLQFQAPDMIERLSTMLELNCLGGKMTRGITVLRVVRELFDSNRNNDKINENKVCVTVNSEIMDDCNENVSINVREAFDVCKEEANRKQIRNDVFCKTRKEFEGSSEEFYAIVCGWSIEILQAAFLVADDIMDGSETRRGNVCWYKRKHVGLDAINDAFVLESFAYYLLKSNFKKLNFYVPLFELFHEVELQTELGQMTDSFHEKQYTMDRYKTVVKFKTSYYTFYLPIACGLILSGYFDTELMVSSCKIALELGEKFQIQDDYLDCYGNPEIIGKVGTDIRDAKCSWLYVQALKFANEEQHLKLKNNYGSSDAQCEAIVKGVFQELNLTQKYFIQEEESYTRISDMIKFNSNILSTVFTNLLNTIHGRCK